MTTLKFLRYGAEAEAEADVQAKERDELFSWTCYARGTSLGAECEAFLWGPGAAQVGGRRGATSFTHSADLEIPSLSCHPRPLTPSASLGLIKHTKTEGLGLISPIPSVALKHPIPSVL